MGQQNVQAKEVYFKSIQTLIVRFGHLWSCEVSLGLSEVQLPQIPGIQKLVTDFCPPVAELVLRVNSSDCSFDPLAKKFDSVRFPVSPGKESIVTKTHFHKKGFALGLA